MLDAATPGLRRSVVFVLSSGQSGSTWLGYVLGSHSHSAFLGEYERAWRPEARVPCTLCAARGLAECEVLHGAEDVPEADAFAWAFGRTGKQHLIDVSKSIEWTQRFLDDGRGYDVRLVHLVKDPRNWFASVRRRNPGRPADLLAMWCETNAKLRAFIARAGCPSTTVFYDELAADPVAGFRKLFAFCTMTFEPAALRYWEVAHHGFAANGASAPLLANAELGPPPAHFATGDDAFYAANMKTLFADTRWKTDLGPAELAEIAHDRRTVALLAALGRRLAPHGLAKLGLLRRMWRLVS
jgi:Sulfotransferase family